MVKRAEFEQELMKILLPAVGQAQDILGGRYNVKFAVDISWNLGTGYHFEDEQQGGGGVGG